MDAEALQHTLQPVVAYYDHTWVDYRLVWLNERNLAIHFGYDDGGARSHAESLLSTNRVMADLADIRPGDRVLDAGCGVAGSSIWLAENRGATVVGISLGGAQLDIARAKVAKRGLTESLALQRADFTATGFPAGSFDVVWALESVCHAPRKADFYRESARLLRSGGRLVMGEYVRSDRPMSLEHEGVLHDWLDGWMIPDLDTSDEHRRHAHTAGLTAVEVRDVTPHMHRSLRRLYKLSFLGVPIGRTLHALGLRGEVLQGNVAGSRNQYLALRRGCWYYAMITARKA
jgi:cyclopropane fatty-acyl-phospholipid synthase-like methyltransferase